MKKHLLYLIYQLCFLAISYTIVYLWYEQLAFTSWWIAWASIGFLRSLDVIFFPSKNKELIGKTEQVVKDLHGGKNYKQIAVFQRMAALLLMGPLSMITLPVFIIGAIIIPNKSNPNGDA